MASRQRQNSEYSRGRAPEIASWRREPGGKPLTLAVACLWATACIPPALWAQQDLTLTGSAPSGTNVYQATNSITATGYTVGSSSNTTFEAGNVIRLENGFHAAQGSTFYATITPLVITPALTSPAPGGSSTSGNPQTFTLTFSDTRGFSDINSVRVAFGGTDSTQAICSLEYANGVLSLWNDAGTAKVTQNSQCGLNGSQATGAGTNTLTLTVQLTFFASFAGDREIYAAGTSASSSFAPWSDLGKWTVVAVSPNFTFDLYPSAQQIIAAGGSRTYDVTITPLNGFRGTVYFGVFSIYPAT